MADVFISYSRKDIDFARRLFDALEQRGRDSWVDWDSIPLSAEWWREVQRGIDGANAFVFVMSPDSLSSPVCTMEVADAIASNKRIIPLVHREVTFADALEAIGAVNPTDFLMQMIGDRDLRDIARENWRVLEGINWIFFRDSDAFDAGVARLVTAVETDLERVRLHTRVYLRAKEWTARDRDESYLLLGSELREASNWLTAYGDLPPPATADHRAYITSSLDREARDEAERRRQIAELNSASERADRSRRIALAAGLAAVSLVVTLILAALYAGGQISSANARIATATIVQGEAENRADAAGTRVAVAEATLAPIPPTLTHAAVVRADAEAEFDIMQALFDAFIVGETNAVRNLRMQDLVAQYPDRSRAYGARGLVLASQGAADAAMADYDRAIDLDPELAVNYANRGTLHLSNQDTDLALADYDRALELDPDNTLYLYSRSTILAARGEYDRAFDDLKRFIELVPESATPYVGMGSIYESYLNDFDTAVEQYSRAIEVDPLPALPYYLRGSTYAVRGELDLARADFQSAIDAEPLSATARVSEGMLAFIDGDNEAALEAFNAYVLIYPTDQMAYFRRAIILSGMGEYQRAVADLDRALQLNPGLTVAYRARAFVHAIEQDYDMALIDMDAFILRSTPDASAFFERGVIRFSLEMNELALADFDRALELDPTLDLARQARAMVLSVYTPEPTLSATP